MVMSIGRQSMVVLFSDSQTPLMHMYIFIHLYMLGGIFNLSSNGDDVMSG